MRRAERRHSPTQYGLLHDLLLRNSGSRRPRHDRRHADQCGARQYIDLPQAARLQATGRADHGNRLFRQSVPQPVCGLDHDRGRRKQGIRRARNADERAHHVSGRAAHRSRGTPHPRHRSQCTRCGRREIRRFVPVRWTDQGRTHAPVHDLHRRQLHRMHHRHALLADRRAQIRQARARPRHALRRRAL